MPMPEYDSEEGISRARRLARDRRRKARRLASLVRIFLFFCLCWILVQGSAFIFGRFTGQGHVLSEEELAGLEVPEWIRQDILPQNAYSRPGTLLEATNGVVIHYTGNPGTTAEQNRSYYGNVALTGETFVSSHFIIGMDGTVIQCVPLNEVAYCSNQRNNDTISIECCHPDASGAFTEKTYDSLIKLLRWLNSIFDFRSKEILRHYDVTGKNCPRYFVEHEKAWEALLDAAFA